MKIESFAEEHTTPNHIALRTDTPLNRTIYNEFLANAKDIGLEFGVREGLIFVRATDLKKKQLAQINRALAAAERSVKKKNEPHKKERAAFLKTISDSTGLPMK